MDFSLTGVEFREKRRGFQGTLKKGDAVLFIKTERKGLEEELYNRLMWKEVKNGSIMGLIEFPLFPEENRMDSPSFPLCFSIPSSFHLLATEA